MGTMEGWMEDVAGGDSTCRGREGAVGSLSNIFEHLRKGFCGYWQLEVAKEEEFNVSKWQKKLRIT